MKTKASKIEDKMKISDGMKTISSELQKPCSWCFDLFLVMALGLFVILAVITGISIIEMLASGSFISNISQAMFG